MLGANSLIFLLFLKMFWITNGGPVFTYPPVTTQDNFTLEQFLGKWFEVAVVSTCPHYMQHKMENPVIVAVELQPTASESNVTMTASTFRNDTCKKTSTNYTLSNTPGRFFYHFAKFAADVDVFVVDTNYVEYAMMVFQSTEQPAGIKSIKVKLYSRTKDVSAAILEDFKTLVRQQEIHDKTVIMNQDRGDCEQMTESSALTLTF